MLELINLAQVDDVRDAIHRAVACLARKGTVGLATDSGYGIISSALDPANVSRIGGWLDSTLSASGAARWSATLLIKSGDELADWVQLGTSTARRLHGRIWPGPVRMRVRPSAHGLASRLSAETQRLLLRDDWLSIQCPTERLTREIVRLTSGPLIQVDGCAINRDAIIRPGLSRDQITQIAELEMILDSGQVPLDRSPTVIEVTEEGWTISRPGTVPEWQIEEWAGLIILFVCTGNTCRSPMAEALCKTVIARRIGCLAVDLPRLGYVVMSAGISTSDGLSAAANAVETVQIRGGDLLDHSSRQVTPELVRQADHILAMTWDHLDALLDQVPDAAHRVRLLDPAGEDIPDPVGMDLSTYRETARMIEQHLEALLGEIGL